jgi:hypothetical protein
MPKLVTAVAELQKIAPPALPQAPQDYSQGYQDQFNRVLRLYFNRFQDVLNNLNVDSGIIPPATNYTVATLPSAAASGAGARAFVTDALLPTFGNTVAGTGAVAVPVYSDGTNWKVG